MAKTVKKKTPKEASELFHNILGASVAGNPKPEKKPKRVRKQFHTEEGDTELIFNMRIFENGFDVTNIQVHSNFDQKIPDTLYLESDNEKGEIKLCMYYSKLIQGKATQVREWLDTPLSNIILEYILETVKEETQKENG